MATSITFTNSFTDGTTRTLTFSPFNTSSVSLSNIRQAVKDLNDSHTAITNAYLSTSGASFKEISQVKIVTENREVIL